VPWSDLPDPDALGVTDILSAVIRRVSPADLVLLGAEALDRDLGQVAPRLAAALDCPFVANVCAARALPDGGLGLIVSGSGGEYRLLGIDLPAVAAVARDSNKPRLAPAARIITIYQDPQAVEQFTLADLDLDPAGLAPVTTLRGESFPPERTLGQMLSGPEAVRQLTDALKGR
jgi:electron transfer flavoprotein beta subunit